jgi:hypothetical protein
MLWVKFEPTTPVCERSKTVHASDRAATVISVAYIELSKIYATIINRLLSGNGSQCEAPSEASRVPSRARNAWDC